MVLLEEDVPAEIVSTVLPRIRGSDEHETS